MRQTQKIKIMMILLLCNLTNSSDTRRKKGCKRKGKGK